MKATTLWIVKLMNVSKSLGLGLTLRGHYLPRSNSKK